MVRNSVCSGSLAGGLGRKVFFYKRKQDKAHRWLYITRQRNFVVAMMLTRPFARTTVLLLLGLVLPHLIFLPLFFYQLYRRSLA
ncbi:hypothetical protein [Taibaiella chishuiensis]|uniref:hypothetical protein n=1 Tax=Taibaiella chishuiensis TaxID=1434707 RepID=UPI000D0D8E2A|nr:hypothetical protein [Taibaiella chishuiensis]